MESIHYKLNWKYFKYSGVDLDSIRIGTDSLYNIIWGLFQADANPSIDIWYLYLLTFSQN